MTLVPLDLPAPDELRGRWAALSAVNTATGFGRTCHAGDGRWHYDDGGGNWVELALLPHGRAVLYGRDHEYSDTFHGPDAVSAEVPETDLFADAPDWWKGPARPDAPGMYGPAFVYGFDGQRWQRARYDAADGFEAIGLPAVSEEKLVASVVDWMESAADDLGAGDDYSPARADVLALAAAGPALTQAQLAAVFGPVSGDLGAGVEAARQFA